MQLMDARKNNLTVKAS